MNVNLRYNHIFASVALCLLAACTADAPDAPDESLRGEVMEFSVGSDGGSTSRASRADGDTPAIKDFNVYGDMISTDTSTDHALIKIMENMRVTYTDSGWIYTGTQYWYPKHEHSFVGISPTTVFDPFDNDPYHQTNPQYDGSVLSFVFTLPADYDPDTHNRKVDILAATHRRYYSDSYGEDGSYIVDPERKTVRLVFGHIMTQINIVAVLDDPLMTEQEYIQIHKMELSDYDIQTEFLIKPAPLLNADRTDDRTITIESIPEEKGSFKLDFSAQPIKVKNDGTAVSLFTVRNENGEDYVEPLIMIPQEFGKDSEAKILLTYRVNELGNSSEKQIVVPLAGMKWESGKSYTYRLIINRTGWHFGTPEIAPWEVTDGDGGDIRAEDYE